MTDNRKLERIPLLKISVAQKFHYDLYSRDFFLHPKDTPITENDLKAFRLWQVETLDPVDNDNTVQRVEFDTALDDSLSIMQQDIMNMHQAQELHQEICDFVTASYQTVFKQLRFHTGEPMASIKQFIEQIRRMGFSILRFQEFQTEGGYVENHAVNSFILTVALGNAAKIPQHRLINLALAAMFHEVGLVKFADLVGGGRTLSVEEFHLQKSHVQDSVDLLEAYDFAPEVMTGILQHHERLDGSGYPHGK
ncbi:MAG: HD domain-containing phosphohydrolase, partial [Spirochaetota bacterium]